MEETDQEKNKNLREPLISKDLEQSQPYQRTAINSSSVDPHKEHHEEIHTWDALQKISSLAIFPIIGMMCHPAYHICNSIILGQNEDPTLLGALGLGGITISIFLQSIGISFNMSLDTLISQAYGQKDKRLCWVYLNRQVYLSIIIYIPLALCVFFLSEPVYLWIGQDPRVAEQAVIFVKLVIPGILFANIATCYVRFLTGQRYTSLNMWGNLGATLVHIPLAIFLSVYMQWNMYGIGIATTIQFLMRLIIPILYIKYSGNFDEGWVSLRDEDSFRNWKQQFSLSVQCASLGIWSWWAFDIFTLIASYLSVAELAAQTVLRNIGLLTYMIPVGIAQASGILVGNNIGSKNIYAARVYAKMCTVTAAIWAIASVIFINVLQSPVIAIFSSSADVNGYIVIAFPIISFFVFFDCVQGVGQGIIRGLGKQGKASIITIVSYWVIGIPISLVMVFYLEWGIVGLWYGPSVAIVINWIFYYVIIYSLDWNQIADEAEQRRLKEKKK